MRGRGAMIAVELVKSGTTEPDAGLTERLATVARAAGVIIFTCGMCLATSNWLLPPLTIGDEPLSEGLDIVCAILADLLACRPRLRHPQPHLTADQQHFVLCNIFAFQLHVLLVGRSRAVDFPPFGTPEVTACRSTISD